MDTPTSGAGVARSRWFPLVWMIPLAIVLLLGVVLAAQAIRALPGVQSFMADYPGRSALPDGAPVGFPAWLGWQHFLSAFFLLFIVRTGWQIRGAGRPSAFWTRTNSGTLRTKNPPVRIGLPLWLHLSVDVLWVLNGIVFYILLFATGQWVRIVPVSWDIIPNAISTAIQYASLNWPTADGWTNYNALQTLTYGLTVFLAAPLSVLTGLRLAPGFAIRFARLDRVFPLRTARVIHTGVMIWFVAFTVVHVTLVLATGALRNLNHLYALRDDQSPAGFWVFAASIVVMIVAWVAARPRVLATVAGVTGTVRR